MAAKSDLRELVFLCGIQGFVEPDSSLMDDEDILLSLSLLEMNRYAAPRAIKEVFIKKPWWETAILDQNYSDSLFRTHFRMSRSCFWNLCDILAGQEHFTEYQEAVHLQVAVALYRLGMYGNAASLNQVAAKFNCAYGSVCNFTERVISALIKLSPEYIKWPTKNERKRIGDEMAVKLLPKCLGFVDGTDVIFAQAPVDNKETYWSRKKHYCMQLQIVCDPQKRIVDFFMGYPGSVHDAKVYSSCPLSVSPDRHFSEGEFIIGDSAYALSETVIVPYRRGGAGLSSLQKKFNRHLSGERVKVEHTIGMLKGRFKSLTDIRLMVSADGGHKRVCDWAHACAVLHNFLLEKDDWMEPDLIGDGQAGNETINVDNNSKKGHFKRQALYEIFIAMSN